MKDYGYTAIKLTEEIGAKATDFDEVIEAIHYNPDHVSAEDIETLKEVKKLIDKAVKLARKVSK